MVRRILGVALIATISVLLLDCGNHRLVSLSVTPSSVTSAVGQSIQFHAIGSYVIQSESKQRPASTQDITGQVSWSSNNTAVATIDSSGAAQIVGIGWTSITASKGNLSASATLCSSSPVSAGSLGPLTAITVIPNTQATLVVGETAQYIAIGTITCGSSTTTQDVTNLVKWISSDPSIVTINNTGLATAVGAGNAEATITAEATASNGSVITATATFTGCITGCGPVTLPAVSVYEVGLGTGTVTGVDSTLNNGVNVINCDPGTGNAAGCVGYFPKGHVLTFTATPATGSTFGGWSSNCTLTGPNTCSFTVPPNMAAVPVGAIFN